MNRRRTLLAGAVAATVLGAGAAQLLPGAAPVARADGLVGYDGCADLLARYRSELAATVTAYGLGWPGGPGILAEDTTGGVARSGAESATGTTPGAVGSGDTGTNLQEQGVDEPDLAKLRDGRLVVLTGNRLRLLAAGPQPRLLGSLRIGDGTTYGGELLLVGDRALVVAPGYRSEPMPTQPGTIEPSVSDGPSERSGAGDVARSMIWNPGAPTTRLALVDLAGDDPHLVEDAVYDGQYVSARLVEGTVRVVTSSQPRLPTGYPLEPGPAAEQESLDRNRAAARNLGLADVLPQVTRRDADGRVVDRGSAVACGRTSYAPGARGAGTLLVTTLRPTEGLAATDSTAVTTDGDLVYASADRLYVATSRWGTGGPLPLADSGTVRSVTDEVSTQLHAFDTTSTTATAYVASGSVPGYVLGRWALSEHEGDLRVATTRQPPWDTRTGEMLGETSSMVVRLAERDGRLTETGRVSGLGRTEQIRAVRYFGDLAVVVTFRQTDPLYLLDLGGDPRLLGELKVPGFSTYLHPLGDGLLLGLGQDATDQGQVTGMAVSVFDISDTSAPRQVDRLRLGPGWSPALDDSRAFTYDVARRTALVGFAGYDPTGVRGEATSALGVRVGADGTLSEAGRLGLDSGAWVSRVLLDDTTAYAVTDGGVVAADAQTLTRTGSVAWGAGG